MDAVAAGAPAGTPPVDRRFEGSGRVATAAGTPLGAIFITGGTGFIGRRVLHAFAERGLRDGRCLTRSPGRPSAALDPSSGWRTVAGDIRDPSSYRSAIVGGAVVVHLAGVVGKQSPREFETQNVEGTRLLHRAAADAGASHFVLVSSIAASYPDTARSPYASSKRAAEDVVAAGRIPYTILRPTMVFGAGSANLAALTRLATLRVPVLFGAGTVAVQPIDVDDVAGVIADASLEGWRDETIEVGGPDTVTLEMLFRMIRAARGDHDRRPIHLPLGVTQRALAFLEPALRPLLPFSAGQLAAFAFPSSARPHARIAARQAGFKRLSDMLAAP